MRKSTAHFRDASRLLSTTVNNGAVPNTCKRKLQPTSWHLSFPLEKQPYNLFLIPNHRRSLLIPTLRHMSTSVAIDDTTTTTKKDSNCQFNHRLHGSLNMFNLTDRLTVADLDHAIKSHNADKAWSIFVTLASQSNEIIPFTMYCSLYSLLKFAKVNGTTTKMAKFRQRQLNHLLDYVQMQSSLEMFMSLVKEIPIPAHKQLLRAIRTENPNEAWLKFYRFHKESKKGSIGDYKLSRNMCLELMLLMMKDKRLTQNQLKMRLQLIALHGAGVSEFDSRYLSAADLGRLAHIYKGYQSKNRALAHQLVDEYVSGIPKKKKLNRADALDELIWRLLVVDDLPKAHEVLDYGLSKKIEINELVFVNLMNAYRRQRNYHASLKLFEQLLETGRKPTIRAFNSVLQVFSAQGSADRSNYIYETMIQLDVSPDVATYTEMIRACSHAGQLNQCFQYYNKMIQNHVQPNEYTFSALIEASARKNDIKSVLRWFQTMLNKDIQPNKIVISALLKSLSKIRFQYPSMAEVVLQIAHQASMTGVKADATLYTILLRMQTELNGIEGTLKIQRDMVENFIEPSTHTYTMLIDVCGKNNMPETAEKIFDLMKKSKKCQPNTVTYSVMIDAWLKAERKDKLEMIVYEFLKACKSDKSGRYWLDSRIRNRIKSKCC